MNEVDSLDAYDGVVIGSAVYTGRWMKEATEFVNRVRPALAGCRVWLFSSGPLGDKPRVDPPQIAELMTSLEAVEHRLFAGTLRKDHLSLLERAVVKGVKAPIRRLSRLGRDRLMGRVHRATPLRAYRDGPFGVR